MAPQVVTATVLVAQGVGDGWGPGAGEVVHRRGERVVVVYASVTDAVAAAVEAAGTGAAVGVALGEVVRGPAGCDGATVTVAEALADRAGGVGGTAGGVLTTAVVRALVRLPGLRWLPAGAVDAGAAGLVDCVEVTPAVRAPASVHLDVPLPPVLALKAPVPFVTRREPWEALTGAWATVAAGGRQVVLVGGEAGTGKTRLVTEFARSVHAGGGVVLYGTCADPLSVPYQPFAEALGHLVTALPDHELAAVVADGGPELGRLVPRLASRVAAPAPAGTGDPEGARFRLFAAVTSALSNLARQRPVLVVLDDLHWAGRPTLQLLDHLTRTPAVGHLGVVATYRSAPAEVGEALKAALPELRRQPGVSRLKVGGFDRPEVRRFVEAVAGHQVDPGLEPVVDVLAGQTDGNAFLLGELWRHLVDDGHLVPYQGRWRVGRPLGDVDSPEGVREVVEARLARLPEPTRRLLGLASVAGTSFAVRTLAAAAGHDGRRVVETLEPAVRASVVQEGGPGEYRFTHVLVQRAVYDGLPIAERRGHHLDVAHALERTHGDGAIADIAQHTAAAVPVADPAAAVAVARRAAAVAQGAVAYDDAARRLEAVLPLVPPDRSRCELLLAVADAHMRAGDVATAQARCLEASSLASQRGEPALVVAAALAFDEANWRAALHGGVAVRLLEAALPLAADQATSVRLRAALARALAFSGRDEEAWTLSGEALRAAREVGDPEVLRTAFTAVMFAPWSPANLDRQIACAREFTDLARAQGDPEWEVWALDKLLFGTISVGHLDEARALAARHRHLARQVGQPLFAVLDFQAHALLALGEGRFVDAEAYATEASETARFLSGNDVAGGYGVQLFSIRREQGRLEEARPMVEAVARLGREGAAWRPALAVLYAELGMLDQAAAQVRHLVGDGLRAVPRDSLWTASLSYLAEAAAAVEDHAAAAAVHRELLPYGGLVVQVGNFLAAYGAVDRYLGELAALLGRAQEAEAHFEAARRIDARARMPVWMAHTDLAHGRFLAARGRSRDVERATTYLRSALDTARHLGMAGVAARAATALGRLGGAPVAGAARAGGLSDREVAVLRLVSEGSSNRDIGARLHISQHTVANHMRSILMKTGCVNRTEAATWALRRGLTTG